MLGRIIITPKEGTENYNVTYKGDTSTLNPEQTYQRLLENAHTSEITLLGSNNVLDNIIQRVRQEKKILLINRI